MIGKGAVLLCAVLLPALAGCPERTAVWVLPGSTGSHLEFGIASNRDGTSAVLIDVLRVNACDSAGYGFTGASWVLSRASDVNPPPTRVTYGQTPLGFRSEQGPRPLAVGCYDVAVSGTGRERFQVRTDGAVVEVQP